MSEKVRAHIIITGKVQGVFFRMETQLEAKRLGVTGWVRNRRDGSVEAIIEGNKDGVTALVKWCHSGPPMATVRDVDINWENYSGAFDEFDINF
ncbi:MAG: acylphosphatase [Desulfobacterales bacterium]|nr:acylphosphatase [Desulfobacterales bacterium]